MLNERSQTRFIFHCCFRSSLCGEKKLVYREDHVTHPRFHRVSISSQKYRH